MKNYIEKYLNDHKSAIDSIPSTKFLNQADFSFVEMTNTSKKYFLHKFINTVVMPTQDASVKMIPFPSTKISLTRQILLRRNDKHTSKNILHKFINTVVMPTQEAS
jgi:hypothetical protein